MVSIARQEGNSNDFVEVLRHELLQHIVRTSKPSTTKAG
jgi:hypothetical protein